MKLYHRFSRFKYRRINPSKKQDERLKWALSLKPGDLINDCSGFNRIVKKIEPDYIRSKKGWAVVNVDFTTEPHDGGCSLIHCGVTKAVPREELESDYISSHTQWRDKWVDQLKMWYGKDKEAWEKRISLIDRRIVIVQSGGHFLDERGILLPEFDDL